ncbi:MAG: DNA alkylation repair protein [Asgard group archaeon]|nr:DNA alkylation repair protein [Asgard group archaeon]
MKLQISSKKKKKYSKEKNMVKKIIELLKKGENQTACTKTEEYFDKTSFKTSTGSVEKGLAKYLALEILDEDLRNHIISRYVRFLWKTENTDIRELASFLIGKIFSENPSIFLFEVITLAKKSNSKADVDTLVHYVLEEQVAERYDYYLEMLYPFLQNENHWVRRLVILALARGFYLSKKPYDVGKCFQVIEESFTDERTVVTDANAWALGIAGLRVHPKEVVEYFKKYRDTEDKSIMKIFTDAITRTKKSKDVSPEFKSEIIDVLKHWKKELEDEDMEATIDATIEHMEKD